MMWEMNDCSFNEVSAGTFNPFVNALIVDDICL